MRILLISNLFPPNCLGGYEIIAGQVCGELSRRGHDLRVLTSDYAVEHAASPADFCRVDRSLRLMAPFGRAVTGGRIRRAETGRFNADVTRRVVEDFRPEVVHVWSLLRLTVAPARVAEQSGAGVVYTFEDAHLAGYLPEQFSLAPGRFLRFVADRMLYRNDTTLGLKLACTTCISESLKRGLIASGLLVKNSHLVYHGIPLEEFPPKPVPGSLSVPPRVLYTGQLLEYKGVHTLIEASHRLSRRGVNVTLTIAGDGPEAWRSHLQKLAASGPARVIFAGRVPHEQLPSLYREHDVFVFSSVWQEPFGLTHLEAMASGLPVISTSAGGQGEVFVDGENSLLFEKENPESLAGRMEELLAGESLRTRLARAGRDLVERRFTLHRYVDDLETLLKQAQGEP